MKKIDQILKDIDNLTPISKVTHRIMEMANDPNGSITDLAEMVECDTILTANVLKLCNSAFYSLAVHVDSVNHAVNLLGIDRVVELALIGSFGKSMSSAQKGYDLKAGDLWTYSMASAMLAKSFAEANCPNTDKYLIYTAALLKDIGKVVIEGYVGRARSKITALVEKKGCSFDEAEKQVLGIDHACLGGLIAKKWLFSPKMVFLIENHHLGNAVAKEHLDAAIIYTTDTVSRMACVHIGVDCLAYRMYDEIFDRFGISEQDMKELMSMFQANLNMAKRLFSSL